MRGGGIDRRRRAPTPVRAFRAPDAATVAGWTARGNLPWQGRYVSEGARMLRLSSWCPRISGERDLEERYERYHPDMEAMHRRFWTKPCFVCRVVGGDESIPRHIVHEDEETIAFLDGYPRAYGYTLVAPKEHASRSPATSRWSSISDSSGSSTGLRRPCARRSAPSGCTSARMGATGATPTSTGTSCRYRLASLTRSSRATGPAGRVGS